MRKMMEQNESKKNCLLNFNVILFKADSFDMISLFAVEGDSSQLKSLKAALKIITIF